VCPLIPVEHPEVALGPKPCDLNIKLSGVLQRKSTIPLTVFTSVTTIATVLRKAD
jgi:hypothetical protein